MSVQVKNIGVLPGDRPLVVFGGVYSNLEALEAMRAWCREREIPSEQIICTGDIVAYCADPEACVQLIRDWGIHCIAGNVEIQLRERQADCGCNFAENSRCDLFSRHWYPYARQSVSEASLSWMEQLPYHLRFAFGGHDFYVVHGSVTDVSAYIFASTPRIQKREQLATASADVILAGHCGLPFLDSMGEGIWFNAGVIGMPANDGTKRVWFGTVEAAETSLSFRHHALTFDSETTRTKMLENQLPREYADTLLSGLWDNCEILPEAETAQRGVQLNLEK